MFQALKEMEKTTSTVNRALSTQWMSDMPLMMIDARSDHCCRPDHNWNVAWTLKKAARKYLAVDTRRRSEVAAEEIGSCLDNTQGKPSDLQGV